MGIKMKSCILLCGGRSKIMGKYKGSMRIHKKPMIIHILESLNNEIDELIIVLNSEKRIKQYKRLIRQKDYNYKIYFTIDEIPDKGPLVGIMTGLKHIHSDYALVLPCDSPYIETDFVYTMFDTLEILTETKDEEINAVVPYHLGPIHAETIKKAEPLHSIYNKNFIPIIEEYIKKDILRVRVIMRNHKCYYIPIDNHLINEINFRNYNRPTDIDDNI